jgi:hypothetical protein
VVPCMAQKPVQVRPHDGVQDGLFRLVALARLVHAPLTSRPAPPKCVKRFPRVRANKELYSARNKAEDILRQGQGEMEAR